MVDGEDVGEIEQHRSPLSVSHETSDVGLVSCLTWLFHSASCPHFFCRKHASQRLAIDDHLV